MQAKKNGADPPLLHGAQMPEEFRYIWNIWLSVHTERDTGMSVQNIKVRDIMGWAMAMRVTLLPFEIEMIRAIDMEFVGAHGNSGPSS